MHVSFVIKKQLPPLLHRQPQSQPDQNRSAGAVDVFEDGGSCLYPVGEFARDESDGAFDGEGQERKSNTKYQELCGLVAVAGLDELWEVGEVENGNFGVGDTGEGTLEEHLAIRYPGEVVHVHGMVLTGEELVSDIDEIPCTDPLDYLEELLGGQQQRPQPHGSQQRMPDQSKADPHRRYDACRRALRDRTGHDEDHILPGREDNHRRGEQKNCGDDFHD